MYNSSERWAYGACSAILTFLGAGASVGTGLGAIGGLADTGRAYAEVGVGAGAGAETGAGAGVVVGV